VRFREGVAALLARGVTLAIEVGPEPHLAGMARRCAPDAGVAWVASCRKERPAGTLLDAVGEVWLAGAPLWWAGFWRGHEGARVDLPQYPFQRRELFVEDPGPRGIVERMAPRLGLGASAKPSFDRAALYRLRWAPLREAPPTTTPTRGTWIVGVDRRGVVEAAAAALEAAGHTVVRVVPAGTSGPQPGGRFGLSTTDAAAWRALAEQHRASLRGWIHGWSLDAPDDAATGQQWTATAETTSLPHLLAAQALLGLGASDAALWLVTAGADAVVAGEAPRLAQAGGWGVARVLALEHRALRNVRVDLDPAAPSGADLARLVLATPSNEDQLAFRRGALHALRLVPHRATTTPLPLRGDGCWILTGGLGALGLAVAEWLIGRGVGRVVLCGRSAPTDAARAAIARMEAAGGQVLVEAVDVANPTHVENLFKYLERKGVPVRGVVHAAGVLADAPILRQDRARFYEVFPAKVQGAWNLHLATQALDLDAFVLFSSVTSTLGAPGQVNYAAANAFLDALAWHRHHAGLPAVSINWGPWGEIGMAAKLAALMTSRGMPGLKTAEALDAMGDVAADLAPQVTFMDMAVRDILAREPSFRDAPLMREVFRLLDPPSAKPAAKPAAAVRTPAAPVAPVAAQPVSVVAHLSGIAERLLGVDAGTLNPSRPLAWQGFDSVMALDLIKAVKAELGVSLDPAAVTVGPSIQELAALVGPVTVTTTAPAPAPVAPAPTPTPAAPTDLRARLAATPAAQRAGVLTAEIGARVEKLMGFNPGDLDPKRPLAWQGFDSVMATDLQARLRADTGVELPLDSLVTGPRVTDLAADLLGRMDLTKVPAVSVPAAPIAAPVAQAAPVAPPVAPAPSAAPGADVTAWLRDEAERLLGFAKGELDINRPLAWQGFDSVMAADLHRRIKDGLGVDLPIDTLVTGPRLSELAKDLAGKARPPATTPAAAPIAAPSAAPSHTPPPSAPPAATSDPRAWLVAEAERLLGFGPGELDVNRPLAWQGFDSVMATDLHRRIKDTLGVDLPMDLLVTGPRLGDLADELKRRGVGAPATMSPAVVAASPPVAATATAPPVTPAAPAVRPAPDALSWAPSADPPATQSAAVDAPAGDAGDGRKQVLLMVLGMMIAAIVVVLVSNWFAATPKGGSGADAAADAPRRAPGKPGGRKGGGAEEPPPAEGAEE
jgi:aryl carrier-like protein